ncbi:TIGR02444 family protein [Ochrobactrum quorumnocens]|nr:TIGR02444 family protein [[Ochrobactrum] quorumnocens]
MNDIDSQSELWSFMLKLYAEPGIPHALLGLQDDHAIDVPFFLAVLHAVTTNHHVTAKAVSALYAEVQEWREKIVIPLRAVRKALKVHSWITRFESTSAFRETIKSVELNAEKIEVVVLERLIPTYFAVEPIDEKPDIFAVSLVLLKVFGFSALAHLPAEAEFIARTIARDHRTDMCNSSSGLDPNRL